MSKHNRYQNSHQQTAFTSEPTLAKIIRWGIYVTAFMPLVIFSQFISPFHFGKVIVFRSVVEVLFVLYLCLIWIDRSYLPRPNRIFWTFLAFSLAFSLATIFSVLPYASFWGSLERMGGLWTFWHYFIFFVMATVTLRRREHWYRLIELSVFTSILSSLYGFGQKTNIEFFIGGGGRERIFGTIGNAALFSGYEIVNFFLALTMLLRPETALSAGRKFFYRTAVVLDGLAIIMATVRGSLLGFGIGIFIFCILYYLRYRSKQAKIIVLSLVTMGAILGFMIITPSIRQSEFVRANPILRRLTDTRLDTYTSKTRFWAWEAGYKGWKEGPRTVLIGWGPENFNIPFSKYFNPKFFTGPGSETLFDRAHNMFVEITVTMGLIGLLTYLSMYWGALSALSKISKARSEEHVFKIGFISLIIAYAIHNAFIFDTSANLLIFFTVLGFISFLLNSVVFPPPSFVARTGPNRAFVWIVGIILMIAAMILIFKTNVASVSANYATTRGIIAGWGNDFGGAMNKYKEALSYNVAGKYEYRHRMAQYVLEYANSRKLTPELVEVINYAIEEVRKNEKENPPDYLPLLYLSRLHIVLGKEDPDSPHNDEALRYSLHALELSPDFVRTYYEVAQAYINKKDSVNAIKYFQRAAELNPTVGISYWYWGVTMIEAGDIQGGLAIAQKGLEKGYVLGESEYLRLINVYFKLGDFKKIAQAYEALVKINPKSPQYYASLAVAYARAGQLDKAVEAAHKAADLDSSFYAEAKRFVESLGRTW